MQTEMEQVSATKAHVEQLFKDGFLFRDENGDIAMPANEEVRQQVAESARKPQPGSHQHSAFIYDEPEFGQGPGGNPRQGAEEAKRNLDEEFADAQGESEQRFNI